MSPKKLILTGILALSVAANSQASDFTFESLANGYYNSVTETDAGLTLTVTSTGGWILVTNPSVALLGSRSVIGTQNNNANVGEFAPLVFTFSSAVSSATFLFGDGGGEVDSPVYIHAYDSSDVFLSTLSETYPENFAAGKSLTWTGAGASYFVLETMPSFNPNSIFWEVTDVATSVPDSAGTIGLLTLALAGLAAVRRRLALA